MALAGNDHRKKEGINVYQRINDVKMKNKHQPNDINARINDHQWHGYCVMASQCSCVASLWPYCGYYQPMAMTINGY